MEHIARLVNPLTALLSGASGLAGGAGQRLEELIQQLTSTSAGLSHSVEAMTLLFGPEGSFHRLEERMAQIEAMIRALGRQGSETHKALENLNSWARGSV